MSALQILSSFIKYDPVTWACVTYKIGYEDQVFFWERSRSKSELRRDDNFPDVTEEEMRRVYSKPFHAEKYVLNRLRIRLEDKDEPRGYVYIFLSKSPCINGNCQYKSCRDELKKFSKDFEYINVKVKYVLDELNNARTFNVDNLSIFPCDIRNWRFLVRRIIHLLNQEYFGDTFSIKRRLHGIRRKERAGVKEIRNVLENILKEHY